MTEPIGTPPLAAQEPPVGSDVETVTFCCAPTDRHATGSAVVVTAAVQAAAAKEERVASHVLPLGSPHEQGEHARVSTEDS